MTAEHWLAVTYHRTQRNGAIRIRMACPDCNLIVTATVFPASQAENLEAALTGAHHQQATGGGDRDGA